MLTGGTQGVVLYREFRARAGEKRKILAWLLGDGYQVESLARCGGDSMVTLRVEVRALPGTVVFVDDLDDWPAADISTADWGAELRVVEANIRNEVGDGDVQAFGHARWPRRALGLRWQHPERTTGGALSRMREARDEFWGRARGGRHNVLLVPRTDENTSTCYGSRTTGPPAASSTSSRTTSSS